MIRAIGIDCAFANMGFAMVTLRFVESGVSIQCEHTHLATTEKNNDKRVRVSSDRLRRARELHEHMHSMITMWDAKIAFAEVPSGSQDAAASFSLGIAVGVLASCPIPVIEVTPMEVKQAVSGSPKISPSKAQIIAWAAHRWPDAGWARAEHAARSKKGILPAGRLLADNEHCADALAIVSAGILTPEFKQAVVFHHAATRLADQRPSSNRIRVHGI